MIANLEPSFGGFTVPSNDPAFQAIESPQLVLLTVAKLKPETLAECQRVAEGRQS